MDFTKILGQIKSLWGKWTLVQKLGLGGAILVIIIAVAALVGVSATPSLVPVIDSPITNEEALANIVTRINEEGVKAQVNANGVVLVADEKTARKMRGILIREDLVPKGTDPWAIFDRDRWTITNFERDVNLQRSITTMVTNHIKALDEVDNAHVTLVMPKDTLFSADQNPVSASVVITPRIGSDITTNRKKIEGIQKLIKLAVEGLKDENIVITDHSGNVLNDFDGMKEIDRLARVEREIKIVRDTESKYRADILKALQLNFTTDRVRDLNIKIDMDMSQKTSERNTITPIILKPRTPGLAYDDSQFVPSLTLSESTSETKWEGTGFNPEGPAGVEGQTPPAYKDMSNLFGKVSQTTRTHNEEFNKEQTSEIRSPTIDRVTVSVNIDGTWARKYDEKGRLVFAPDGKVERIYTPLSPEDIAKATALVEGAIGYDAARKDIVRVQNIAIDRTEQFAQEDAALARERQIQITIIASLIGIAVLLVGFVIFQIIARAREQARRRREEELARQHQLMRESALLEAEKEGETISMSVEDQARMELAEKAIALAREHPQDVSQLIRTWLMEE
ncbi:MAG: flagellar M-ring protein FliF [Spirochaetaceae bacterium]|jgi:flagellar M-ring protein FliF|nr:flagellar M-ring protein FliF [Spirochaetaceae bacterium]